MMKNTKKSDYYKRVRIHNTLSSTLTFPLTIVEAPTGYGKTTTLRHYLRELGIKPLWVSISEPYDQLAHVWLKIAESFSTLCPHKSEIMAALGFPQDAPQTAHMLRLLRNFDFSDSTVLVLDDFHFTDGEILSHFIFQLVKEEIEGLSIVILTRDTRYLNYPELVAKGLCAIISVEELKFTPEETANYCLNTMPTLSSVEVDKIVSYTDGWIAQIYLQIIGLINGHPIGPCSTSDALIDKVLYSVLDTRIQNFLHKLTLVDRFTAQKAKWVTEYDDAPQLLDHLRKTNAFIHFDENTKYYSMHQILREFLIQHTILTKQSTQQLNRRLGHWYLLRKKFTKAYKHLYRAGDIHAILHHLNQPENIRNELTEFEHSKEMFSTLSDKDLYQYPLTYLQHLLITIIKGQPEEIISCAKALKAFQQQFTSNDDAYRTHMLAESLIIEKFTNFNFLAASTEKNKRILELLNGRQSYIMQENNEFTFGSPHILYIYFRDAGSFKSLLELAQDSFGVYQQYANGCGTGSECLVACEYHLELGDLERAAIYGQRAITKAKSKNQVSILLCAYLSLARIHVLKGEQNLALECIDLLERHVRSENNPIFNTSLDMVKAYIYGLLGLVHMIPQWLLEGDMATKDFFYQGIAFNYLVYGKVMVATKNWHGVEVISQELTAQFNIYSNQLGHIHNKINCALASTFLHGVHAGATALDDALFEAHSDGIMAPFLEHAVQLYAPLLYLLDKGSQPLKTPRPFIQNVFNRVRTLSKHNSSSITSENGQTVMTTPASSKADLLSKREREVLELCAEGLSRQAIARHLNLSEGTVKTHLQNIYQKLEVSGKIAAIRVGLAQKIN